MSILATRDGFDPNNPGRPRLPSGPTAGELGLLGYAPPSSGGVAGSPTDFPGTKSPGDPTVKAPTFIPGSGFPGSGRQYDWSVQDATQRLQDAYKKYLGRAASAAEIDAQLRGQGWQSGDGYVGAFGLQSVLDSIQNSEEAKQYQSKQTASAPPTDPTTRPTVPPPPPAPPTSPVTATGGIPPPAAAQNFNNQSAGTPASAGPPASTDVDPFAAIGGGVKLANGDWVPKDHPLANGVTNTANTNTNTTGTPKTDLTQVLTTDAFGQTGTSVGPGLNSPVRPTNTTYTPGTVSQFTPPDQTTTQNGVTALINAMLTNPHSITDEGFNMMLERGKETALAQQQGAMNLVNQQLARQGMSDSGLAQTQARRLGDATQQQLLSNQREGYLARMLQNRADELSAVGAAEGALTGEMNRGIQGYNTTLAGQMAQEGLGQAGASSALQSHLADLQAWSEANAANQSQETLALQKLLGEGGLGVDWGRIHEGARQFDLGNQLNWSSLLSNMSNNLGNQQFNWASLLSGYQNPFTNWLAGGA